MARKRRTSSSNVQLIIGPMIFGLACCLGYYALFLMDDEHIPGQETDPNDPFACPLGYAGDGPKPPKVPCDDLYDEQQYTKAIGCYREELTENREKHGLADIRTVSSMIGVANVLEHQDKLEEALEMYQQVLDIRLERFDRKGRLVSSSQQAIASVLMKMNRIDEAEVFWSSSILTLDGLQDLSEEAEIELAYDRLEVLDNIGLTNYYLGNNDKAYAAWTDSLSQAKLVHGPMGVRVGEIHMQLGGVCNKLQQYDAATENYDSAIVIFGAALGEEHILVASAEADKGSALYYAGDIDGAKQAMSRSLSILEFIGMESSDEYKLTRNNMEKLG